jgi:prepilin peptidase CpaA
LTSFEVGAIAIGIAACYTDVTTRKVPNVLTGASVVAGLVAHAVFAGGAGIPSALLGLAVGLLVFLPFFALGGMGGGDVKLMGALGTWVGWNAIVWAALYGAVAGGVIGVVVGLSHGYLRQAIANVGGLFVFWATQGVRPVAALTLEHGHGPRLPYALPIFVGLVAAIWLR